MKNNDKRRKLHKFSEDEIDFICENARNLSFYKVTQLFNDKFGLDIKSASIGRVAKRNGVNSSSTSKKLPNSTMFTAGHKPYTIKPLGSEVLTYNGFIKIKVGDPNVWRYKHHLLYEKYNGIKLKKYDCVIFLDGNKNNFSKDNLFKISRSEQLIFNKLKKSNIKSILDTQLQIAKLRALILKKSKYTNNMVDN